MTFEPILLLSMWAAGLALVAAVVAWWDIVGRGYLWLTGVTAAVIGFAAAFDSTPGVIAVVLTLAATAIAGQRMASSALFAAGGIAFLTVAAGLDGWLPAIAGSAALGGITGEMLLGHWFLIDPTLPRWALKRLAAVGLAGVGADVAVLMFDAGGFGGEVIGWAFVVLAATTFVLLVAVWFALNEPSYPGVMAATGLSYLAILTAIGAAAAGRALVDEGTSLLGGDAGLSRIFLL